MTAMKHTKRQHYDLTAEASVLGGVFHDRAVMRKLVDLEVDDFAHVRHQVVWMAMRALESAGTPIDVVTVSAEVKRLGKWEVLSKGEGPDPEANAMGFLAELLLLCPSASNVVHYAEIVVKHRVSRDLRACLVNALGLLDGPDSDDVEGEDAVQWVASEVRQIRTRGKDRTVPVGTIVRERLIEFGRIEEARINGGKALTGIPTGIAKLDELTGGYQRGIVTVVCGRPGMGKSSGAMAAADACSALGLGVHVFSLEDPRSMYADRVIARMSRVPSTTLRRVAYTREDFEAIRQGTMRADARKTWRVDDRSGLTAPEIIRSWRRSGDKHGTQLVVIDLLQRIRKTDARMETYKHVTEVMHLLSDAAKEDQIAVVLLAQLNREIERRNDKRPVMSDLQDAGTVEQDAKAIIGYYRGAYYYPKPIEGIDYDEGEPCPSVDEFQQTVQLLVLKDSNGATGSVFGRWHGETQRLS